MCTDAKGEVRRFWWRGIGRRLLSGNGAECLLKAGKKLAAKLAANGERGYAAGI